MNARARVLAAINRQPLDRLPVDLWYTPEVYETLAAHFGVDDEVSLWRALGIDKIAWVGPAYAGGDGESGEHNDKAGIVRTHWGVELREVNTGTAKYLETERAPLAGMSTVEELNDYPYWPDPDKFDYESAATRTGALAAEFPTLGPWISLFEVYTQMRGMEQAMLDLLVMPDFVNAALDRIEACQTEMVRRFYDRAGHDVDMIFLSDDMGSQSGLFFSLEAWDQLLSDRMKRWCDLAHSYGVKVFYHSDGAVEELVPRLIDCGVDVLNPIQHVCAGMERARLKDRYGDRLVFHGGVENQQILPFGTVDEVRAEVRACFDTLGRSGDAYICCSCHNIQPGTPVENILAMVETAKNQE